MLHRLLTLAVLCLALASPAGAASLLPNGKQQFIKADGSPCVGCSVFMYIPETTTPKDTWTDADETVLNTNPVITDSLGTAVIYGSGVYRQILKDETGVTLWDQPTADPVSLNAGWGGLSTGSANAQAVSVGSYSAEDGQIVYFLAGFSNTGAMTLNVDGTGATEVVKDTAEGPIALGGGEVVIGNVIGALYSSTTGQFHLITPTPTTSFDGAVFFNGYITPTILSANQDNWTPAGGFSSANTVRISSTQAIGITGLTNGASGRQVSFQNIGLYAITFVANSTDSTFGNRFLLSNSVVLNPGDSLTLQYDALSSGWRSPGSPAPIYAPGFIFGCTQSTNASDATNDIDITACSARASNSIANEDAIAMTKRLDADWAAGTNQGMRYAGAAIADTTYHVFVISTASGTGDYFAYTGVDPTSVLPSGYVNYRRIGSIIRVSSANLAFFQDGDNFTLKSPVLSVNGVSQTTTAALRVLTVPLGINVYAVSNVRVFGGSGEGSVYISSPDVNDDAPSSTVAPLTSLGGRVAINSGAVTANETTGKNTTRTDTSSQLRYRALTNTITLYVAVTGWIDSRGRQQ